jgi:hypothetical protein
MASVIKLRTIGGVDDKRIQLVNSNFARPFTVSTTWSKLRVGVRWIMGNTGANLTGTPKLFFGLCSGSTNLPLDPSTTHFLGIYNVAATWTYQAGPPVRYAHGSSSFSVGKRVGTTNTSFGTPGQIYTSALETQAYRQAMFVDITKGSPNFTVGCLYPSAVPSIDVSQDDFLTQMVLPTPVLTGHTFTAGSAGACDEGVDGTLNHVYCGWDRVSPVFEICDLAVAKLA